MSNKHIIATTVMTVCLPYICILYVHTHTHTHTHIIGGKHRGNDTYICTLRYVKFKDSCNP